MKVTIMNMKTNKDYVKPTLRTIVLDPIMQQLGFGSGPRDTSQAESKSSSFMSDDNLTDEQ